MKFAPIVEGFGEVESVPILIRRIGGQLARGSAIEVLRPHRVKRQKIVHPGELERVVDFAARKIGPDDAIVILLDADDDCPASLGPTLLRRAEAARPDRKVSVVLAKRSYEAWLIAGAESLRGVRTLSVDLSPPADAEAVGGAKHWLDTRMTSGYSETIDQAALTAAVDLVKARAAPSFDKFVRDIARLMGIPPTR